MRTISTLIILSLLALTACTEQAINQSIETPPPPANDPWVALNATNLTSPNVIYSCHEESCSISTNNTEEIPNDTSIACENKTIVIHSGKNTIPLLKCDHQCYTLRRVQATCT